MWPFKKKYKQENKSREFLWDIATKEILANLDDPEQKRVADLPRVFNYYLGEPVLHDTGKVFYPIYKDEYRRLKDTLYRSNTIGCNKILHDYHEFRGRALLIIDIENKDMVIYQDIWNKINDRYKELTSMHEEE